MGTTPYSRMLSLGSREGSTPIEDFLTEALAAAANRDPRPLISLLKREGVRINGELTASTQVVKPDAGRLDLVLSDDSVEVAWVEVKAWAGEHGDQLKRYLTAAKARQPTPVVMMLATSGAIPSTRMPRVTWHALVHAIAACAKPSHLWLELQALIQERGLGGGETMPFTKEELQSFHGAKTGIEKFAAFVNELYGTLGARGSKIRWHANLDVVDVVTDHIQRQGRALYQFDPIPRPSNTMGRDPLVFLWVAVERGRLHIAIEGRASVRLKSILGASYSKLKEQKWQLTQDNILEIAAPPRVLASEERAVSWCVARIEEVESSGAHMHMLAAARKGGIKYYDE